MKNTDIKLTEGNRKITFNGSERVFPVTVVTVNGVEVGHVAHYYGSWDAYPVSGERGFSYRTRKEAVA